MLLLETDKPVSVARRPAVGALLILLIEKAHALYLMNVIDSCLAKLASLGLLPFCLDDRVGINIVYNRRWHISLIWSQESAMAITSLPLQCQPYFIFVYEARKYRLIAEPDKDISPLTVPHSR